jgi:hypothetical protein
MYVQSLTGCRDRRGTAPRVPNLSIRWLWVVSSTPLCFQGQSRQYRSSRMGGSHSWSGRFGEEWRILPMLGFDPRIVESIPQSLRALYFLRCSWDLNILPEYVIVYYFSMGGACSTLWWRVVVLRGFGGGNLREGDDLEDPGVVACWNTPTFSFTPWFLSWKSGAYIKCNIAIRNEGLA